MYINGKEIIKRNVKIEVNPTDVILQIAKDLGFYTNDYHECITLKDDKIVRMEDTSYHGSPSYEVSKVISDKKEDIELYKALTKAYKLLLERNKQK